MSQRAGVSLGSSARTCWRPRSPTARRGPVGTDSVRRRTRTAAPSRRSRSIAPCSCTAISSARPVTAPDVDHRMIRLENQGHPAATASPGTSRTQSSRSRTSRSRRTPSSTRGRRSSTARRCSSCGSRIRRGLSHLHVARSTGRCRRVASRTSKPLLSPEPGSTASAWGYEDARVVRCEELGSWVITCTAFGPGGPCVYLATTGISRRSTGAMSSCRPKTRTQRCSRDRSAASGACSTALSSWPAARPTFGCPGPRISSRGGPRSE